MRGSRTSIPAARSVPRYRSASWRTGRTDVLWGQREPAPAGVEANPYRNPGEERYRRRARRAVQHKADIILTPAYRLDELEKIRRGIPLPPADPPTIQHGVDVRVALDHLPRELPNREIDRGFRKTFTKRPDHRRRHQHIAQAARLEYQNPFRTLREPGLAPSDPNGYGEPARHGTDHARLDGASQIHEALPTAAPAVSVRGK